MKKSVLMLLCVGALVTNSAFAKTYTYTVTVTNKISNATVHGSDKQASPPISDTPIATSSNHTFKVTDDGKSFELHANGHKLCDFGMNSFDLTQFLEFGSTTFKADVSGKFIDHHHYELYCGVIPTN